MHYPVIQLMLRTLLIVLSYTADESCTVRISPTNIEENKRETCKLNTEIKDCGDVKIPLATMNAPRITGGYEAIPHSLPWIVALFTDLSYPIKTMNRRGSGTIIHPWVVVTAAHCIYDIDKDYVYEKFVVRVGAHDLEDIGPNDRLIAVDMYDYFKPFNSSYNDIAILKLKERLTFNEHVQPVCLPESDVKIGDILAVAGWGKIDESEFSTVLRRVEIDVLDGYNNCELSLFQSVRVICAGDNINFTRDSCDSDSGGGLYSFINDKYYLQGIVSGGSPKCNGQGYYTNVYHFLNYVIYFMNYFNGEF